MTEHSKEVMERRRQGFEGWASKNGISIVRTNQALGFANGQRRDAGDYIMLEALCAWYAYNVAIDSIEIEMPAAWSASMLDGDQVLQDCRYAIESTGIGLRVKA